MPTRFIASIRYSSYYLELLRTLNGLYKEGSEASVNALRRFDQESLNIYGGQAWAAKNVNINMSAKHLCNQYPQAGYFLLNGLF
jgi:hypothetical protein